MVKKILFKISAEGDINVEVLGAQGTECEAMTAPFELELGVVASKELKDSYFQSESQATHQEQEND